MQKQENFYQRVTGVLFWVKNIKSAIWDRTSPHLHIKSSLYVCRRVQGSQILKQNWIILFCSKVIAILLIWVSSTLDGGAYPEWTTIVYMSSGVFRGKESSNRIELCRLVQDFLNSGVLGSLWLWGGGRWVGGCLGAWGCPHTHAHACTCMHTHTHTFIHV